MMVNSGGAARRIDKVTSSGPVPGLLTVAENVADTPTFTDPFAGESNTGSSGAFASATSSKSTGAQLCWPMVSVTLTFQKYVSPSVTSHEKVTSALTPARF